MPNPNASLLHMEIVGAQELERALRDLGSDRLIKSTNKRALLNAAAPVVTVAKRLAPRGKTGRMADNIAASTTLSRRQRRTGQYRRDPSTAHVWIGSAPRGPGVLTEFGTGPRYHKETGRFVGAAPAQPFMRPAWEQGKEKVLRDYSAELWTQIEKSAKRLARRQAKAGLR